MNSASVDSQAESPQCAEYGSDVYYSVVLGTARFRGWRCLFAGDGSLVFEDEPGNQKSFHGGHGHGWLRRAWEEFTRMAIDPAA